MPKSSQPKERKMLEMPANMNPKKNPMPTQEAAVRAHNFQEVATGYSEEVAIDEAMRCLNCKNMPCVTGCPVNIHIPEFIAKIKEGDFEGAYQIINITSSLPAVCGRVCPQETQCESKCVRGIKGEPVGIGRLERFVADWHNAHATEKPQPVPSNGHKVAIVGSGPSGLTCAGDLAKKGYKVTVFEALHTAGGVLVYGIPEFRLPKAIVQQEVDNLVAMGVDMETNIVIGKTLTVDELFEQGYEASLLAFTKRNLPVRHWTVFMENNGARGSRWFPLAAIPTQSERYSVSFRNTARLRQRRIFQSAVSELHRPINVFVTA